MIIAFQYIRLPVKLKGQERIYFFFDLAAQIVAAAGRGIVAMYFFSGLLLAQQFAYLTYRQYGEKENKKE